VVMDGNYRSGKAFEIKMGRTEALPIGKKLQNNYLAISKLLSLRVSPSMEPATVT